MKNVMIELKRQIHFSWRNGKPGTVVEIKQAYRLGTQDRHQLFGIGDWTLVEGLRLVAGHAETFTAPERLAIAQGALAFSGTRVASFAPESDAPPEE
jgi:hypothetical protein